MGQNNLFSFFSPVFEELQILRGLACNFVFVFGEVATEGFFCFATFLWRNKD